MSSNKGVILLVAFGLLIVGYFWDALSRPVIMGERDLAVFFFPSVKLWLESLQGGVFPLWNPYTFSGQPLFASLQPAILYPPNWILFFTPLVKGFNLIIALHFFLAGWFIYLLCRELGGSPGAGLISSLSFSLGGFLLSLHSMLSSLQSAVWAPLIVFFLLRAMKSRARKYLFLTLGAVLVQFLGGGIEIFLLTQGLVFFLILFPRSFLLTPFPPLFQRLQMAGLIYGLFLGLGAVQILPFGEMVFQSARGLGLSYAQATSWSLSFSDLGHLFLPDWFHRGTEFYFVDQNWVRTIYLGIIPFILLFFFFTGGDQRRVWWAGLLLVSLVLSLGRNTPIYGFLYRYIPGVDLIRYPVKFFFLANMTICLLAGLGWEAFSQRIKEQPSPMTAFKRVALVMALSQALFLFILASFKPALIAYLNHLYPVSYDWPWTNNLHNYIRFTVITLFVFLWLAVIADRKISLKKGGWGLTALFVVDLFLGNWGQYQVFDRESYLSPSGNTRVVQSDPSLVRVYTDPTVLKTLNPNKKEDRLSFALQQDRFIMDYPVVQRIFNARGFPVLVTRPYRDLVIMVETSPVPQATDILRFLNVKYIIWPAPVSHPAYKLVRKMGVYELPVSQKNRDHTLPPPSKLIEPHFYEISNVLPRAFLAPEYRVIPSEREMREIITAKAFDPARTVLLAEVPRFPLADPGAQADRDAVRISEYGLNHIRLEASCLGPRMLFLSEVDYPGWKAVVDGKPQKIYRANHAFRALALGPGTHHIQLVYRPASFYGGLAVTGVTAVILLSWGVVRRFRVRTSKKNSRSTDGPEQ